MQVAFVFWLLHRTRSQNTAKDKLLKNLEKHSVVSPLVHAVVLSSLATKPNLNNSKVNLSPLFPLLCLSLPPKKCCAFVVCLCKQAVWERWIEAGGHWGFTVMSIKEKQNTEKGQSAAAWADLTLNQLLTCLSCRIPGEHDDRGTGIRFPERGWLMSSGRRLFLTFNLSW